MTADVTTGLSRPAGIPLPPGAPSFSVGHVPTDERAGEFAERGYILVPRVVPVDVLAQAARRLSEVSDAEPVGEPVRGTFTLLAGVLMTDQLTENSGNLWVWPGTHLTHAAGSTTSRSGPAAHRTGS
jgi:hypothetical protein